MAGPTISSVSPAPNATGVVLGQAITIVFGSLIDHTTLTAATISVTCPSGAEILTPESYIVKSPQTQSGTASVNATYTLTDSSTETTLVIQPSTPLLPDTVYTVFLLGGDAQFSPARIKDTNENSLAVSYHVFLSGQEQKRSRAGGKGHLQIGLRRAVRDYLAGGGPAGSEGSDRGQNIAHFFPWGLS